MTQQQMMYTLFSCLIAVLVFSVHANSGDAAKHASVHDSCTAVAKEGQESEHKAKNLLQISHGHKAVEAGDEQKAVEADHEQKAVEADDEEAEIYPGFTVYNGKGATAGWENGKANAERPVTFITVYDPYFETNLGTSFLWKERAHKPHQWILINNNHNFGISKMYAEAQAAAVNDLLVFLHPDIMLPPDFYDNFMHKLWVIQGYDTNWGVLGVVGVPYGEFRSNSSITDFAQTYQTNSDFLPVQGVDECLFVLNKESPKFDPKLPGFDMYGLDIVLSARRKGQMSYLLNVPVYHKLRDLDGSIFQEEAFNAKVDSAEYVQRVSVTSQYFQQKWCKSGFLPVMGPSFRVECNAWCKVIDMLNRSHHNETCVDPTGEFPTGHLIR